MRKTRLQGKVVWLLLIYPSMGNRLLVNPIFLLPQHSFPAWNLPGWTGFIKAAEFRTITKSLESIFLLAGIPMVDDHLHPHAATPDASYAFPFVGADIQSSMPSLPIYFQIRRRTLPRGRRYYWFLYPLKQS
jgi:hypothetical protein